MTLTALTIFSVSTDHFDQVNVRWLIDSNAELNIYVPFLQNALFYVSLIKYSITFYFLHKKSFITSLYLL